MGGGGSSTPAFSAQGAPPNFDYQQAAGLNQLAIGGDIQSYALSDQDFANRYPALQQAYQTYQANLNPQLAAVNQGQQGQTDIMSGLANTIAGRQGTDTTGDINNIRNAAATTAGAAQPIFNLGASQAGLAQPLIGMGQQQAGLAGGLQQLSGQINRMGGQQAGIGNQINTTGGQVTNMAATPYNVGQQLLNEPIDPQTQQQMMRAGLSSAAGSLGAASLGQGMAGQAAAARQLGLNTVQYGQQMRGEAMGDISQAASIAGQGGQLQGLGASTIGAGAQTRGLAGQTTGLAGQQISQGAQTIGLGGSQLQAGAQTYGLGANTAATAGGLYGQAQNAQEQYGMDTTQMASTYGAMQQQQNQALLGNIANANSMFQKRSFGLGGTNIAQSELGQSGAYNSFQQANYATMNGIAYNSAQMQAQQNQLNAQQSAGMTQAGVGVATAVATTSATIAAMSCWVAAAVYGQGSRNWKVFRHYLLNKAPAGLRRFYLRHGEAFAGIVRQSAFLRAILKLMMDPIIERTAYVGA